MSRCFIHQDGFGVSCSAWRGFGPWRCLFPLRRNGTRWPAVFKAAKTHTQWHCLFVRDHELVTPDIPQASASFFEVRRGRIINAALYDRLDGARKVLFTATTTFQPGLSFTHGRTPAFGPPHCWYFITASSLRLFICKEEPNLIDVSLDRWIIYLLVFLVIACYHSLRLKLQWSGIIRQ